MYIPHPSAVGHQVIPSPYLPVLVQKSSQHLFCSVQLLPCLFFLFSFSMSACLPALLAFFWAVFFVASASTSVSAAFVSTADLPGLGLGLLFCCNTGHRAQFCNLGIKGICTLTIAPSFVTLASKAYAPDTDHRLHQRARGHPRSPARSGLPRRCHREGVSTPFSCRYCPPTALSAGVLKRQATARASGEASAICRIASPVKDSKRFKSITTLFLQDIL